jgi:asparagine synthase (glutamine-hydrolysing)
MRVRRTGAVPARPLARTSGVFRRHGLIVAFHGHPFGRDSERRCTELADVVERLLEAFIVRDVAALGALHGDYALALIDPRRERVILAVDRMSVRNIVYAAPATGIVFGPTCDVISRHPAIHRDVDNQAIYNYLHFHMVPGPSTIFHRQRRVPPGHFVDFESGTCTVQAHWRAHFVEDSTVEFATLKRTFRTALEESVRTLSKGERCGTFLSGGTDSSTITGLLGATSGAPAQTFSIGFDAEGYDEMLYARIAARHFGAAQHEYYVTPSDVVNAIPRIADTYDQPFGNASAVPTYYCAKLAHDSGISRMLGGDGGDELYGGNVRYAKQRQFALYERIPPFLRYGLIEPLANRLPLTGQVALLRKARSYVAQASMPMPERYESYNLLERLGATNVLTADFLAGIDTGAPTRRLREVYGADTQIELVAFGQGINMLKFDAPVSSRVVEAQKNNGAKIYACENSMAKNKLSRNDMAPDVVYVRAGVEHIISRQREGWVNLRP